MLRLSTLTLPRTTTTTTTATTAAAATERLYDDVKKDRGNDGTMMIIIHIPTGAQ